MDSTTIPNESGPKTTDAPTIAMRLEVVVIPVSDVELAKNFYGSLGWRLDAEFSVPDDYHIIQFTPPGSGCSIIFGKNVTAAAPGSAQGLYLIVSDIKAACEQLLERGVAVSNIFHDAGGVYSGADEPYLFGRQRVDGPDPEYRSYRSFASFRDPDGNGWPVAGGHSAPAGTRRTDHKLRFSGRTQRRTARCGSSTRRTRAADRTPGCRLAQMVCRAYCQRAGRQTGATMNRGFDLVSRQFHSSDMVSIITSCRQLRSRVGLRW